MKSFTEYLVEEKKEKVICSRCGGSGHYSYNPIHGTMCYGCQGKGFNLKTKAEIKSIEKRKAAKQLKDQEKQKEIKARVEEANKKFEALERKFGPFSPRRPEDPHELKRGYEAQSVCQQIFGRPIYQVSLKEIEDYKK